MSNSDSLTLLMSHAGLVAGPRLEDGIVGMLRPFQGIVERNLHEVVEALFNLRSVLSDNSVPRDLSRSVMMILSNLRAWAIRPDGALQRNRLLDVSQTEQLGHWYEIIESAVLGFMGSQDHSYALYRYLIYVYQYTIDEQYFQFALFATIEDAFTQHDDYKLAAVNLCVKYPAILDRFRVQVDTLRSSTVSREIQESLARLNHPSG